MEQMLSFPVDAETCLCTKCTASWLLVSVYVPAPLLSKTPVLGLGLLSPPAYVGSTHTYSPLVLVFVISLFSEHLLVDMILFFFF